ncbi:hypothetical protein F5Y08DRAFT_300771 [Xylaria arbuscula]|nr:hypothetical protein F5Y08DRAFT_300771 [Xylaria arbuscula]
MNTLLAAFARGCRRMPSLQSATLVSEYFKTWPFEVHCIAPATEAPKNWDTQFAEGKRMKWRVFFHIHDWRPRPETLEEFRLIGRESKRSNDDALLHFLPWGDFAASRTGRRRV